MNLAIVIPYYKLEFFEKTLSSLSNQTDKRFNVYIGNDNSPSNPEDLLLEYSLNYTYKKFENNLGSISLVEQWERCFKILKDEEWVMILGDDDVLGENVVEEFYKNIEKIEKKSINVIRYCSYKIDGDGNKISSLYKHPKIEKSTDFIFRKTRSSLSEYIFKREKVDTIKFKKFPLAWYSDVLGVLEFSDYSKVFTVNKAFVLVRISNLSISGSSTKQKEKNKARLEYYYYLLTKKNLFFNVSQQIELLAMLEKTYLNDKKNIRCLFKVLLVHVKTFKFKYLITFFKSIILSLVYKKNYNH